MNLAASAAAPTLTQTAGKRFPSSAAELGFYINSGTAGIDIEDTALPCPYN
ncbi:MULTISPECIES: hypothetical protein [unclassified Microcoleus]|uniref:hypothetical protein n=1 Tax=unclassified Microcoleus TaxID=2642155 RepID=UPI002FD7099C